MSNRQKRREERRKNQKNTQLTILLVVLGLGLVVAGILFLPTLLEPAPEIVEITPIAYLNPQGRTIGDSNAPVKVEEFSDFQCPYCKQVIDQFEPQIIEQYVETHKIQLTFTPFSFVGQESIDAASAAFCALDQGKFWEYRDILYANQIGENVGSFKEKNLIAFADSLGLNMGDFKNCFKSQTHLTDVEKSNNHASELGVTGTPSFAVNGKVVSAAELINEIEAALAK